MYNRKTQRRQRGAGPWRQGADTCVYIPSLVCQEDIDKKSKQLGRALTETEKEALRDKTGLLSRVTHSDDPAYNVELIIKGKFRGLFDNQWVTSFESKCSPYFANSDKVIDPAYYRKYPNNEQGACKNNVDSNFNPRNKINLLAKRFGQTFGEYIDRNGFPVSEYRAFDMFQIAISAAVAMVPDGGPWIIHTDLHANNILAIPHPTDVKFALHDWGRSLVIERPNDLRQSTKNIRDFVRKTYGGDIVNGVDKYGNRFLNYNVYMQLPEEMVRVCQQIHDGTPLTNADLRILRVWGIFVMFKHILSIISKPYNLKPIDILIHLSQAANHADLINKVQESYNFLMDNSSSPNQRRHSPPYVLPPPAARVPPPVPAPAAHVPAPVPPPAARVPAPVPPPAAQIVVPTYPAPNARVRKSSPAARNQQPVAAAALPVVPTNVGRIPFGVPRPRNFQYPQHVAPPVAPPVVPTFAIPAPPQQPPLAPAFPVRANNRVAAKNPFAPAFPVRPGIPLVAPARNRVPTPARNRVPAPPQAVLLGGPRMLTRGQAARNVQLN